MVGSRSEAGVGDGVLCVQNIPLVPVQVCALGVLEAVAKHRHIHKHEQEYGGHWTRSARSKRGDGSKELDVDSRQSSSTVPRTHGALPLARVARPVESLSRASENRSTTGNPGIMHLLVRSTHSAVKARILSRLTAMSTHSPVTAVKTRSNIYYEQEPARATAILPVLDSNGPRLTMTASADGRAMALNGRGLTRTGRPRSRQTRCW